MTTPEPVTDPIAKQVAEIKSEFDLGGYFSDRSHTEKAEQLLDALADQLRAALPATPEPVTGATQDPRGPIAAQILKDALLSERSVPIDEVVRKLLPAVDAADAAAGIRRVRLDESIERAAKASYEQYPGHVWADASEVQQRAHREQVRTIVTAALGGAP